MSELNFGAITPETVLAEIQADAQAKGSLSLTILANEAVEQSDFLVAVRDAIGEDPFEFVLKSSYKDSLKQVVVRLNPDLLNATLPAQYVEKIRALATTIQRSELKAGNPEFQAYKRAICSELTKAIVAQSQGNVNLEWDEKFGTDFLFTHSHTSDAKKQAIEEQREARSGAQSGAGRVRTMRTRFTRSRS